MLGVCEEKFINYVKDQNSELYDKLYHYMIYERDGGHIISDGHGGFINLKHLAAVAEGYFTASLGPDQWYGWAGDMASAIWNTERYVDANGGSYQDAADIVVGNDDYDFSYIDMCADADAIKIAELISGSSSAAHSFSEALRNYYNTYVGGRFLYLLDDIGCKANLTAIKEELVHSVEIITAEAAWVIGSKLQDFKDNPLSGLEDLKSRLEDIPSSKAFVTCCLAFANYLYCELG